MLEDMSPILLAFRVARFTRNDLFAAAIAAHFHMVLFCELLNSQALFSGHFSRPLGFRMGQARIMADTFVVLPCENCGAGRTLPLRSLGDIIQHRRPSSKETDFVNFVCPHCGLGSLHLDHRLERREAMSVPRLVRPPLYCAFLECDSNSCTLRVSVHAIAQSGESNAEPTTAWRNWKVGTLECSDGHHAKEPIALLAHHVFSPESE